jgi:hypothetical protein
MLHNPPAGHQEDVNCQSPIKVKQGRGASESMYKEQNLSVQTDGVQQAHATHPYKGRDKLQRTGLLAT